MQSVGEVAQAVAQLKNLQEGHYEDTERAAEPLEVPAEIVQLAEYRRRRPSDRSGVRAVRIYRTFVTEECATSCSLSHTIRKAILLGPATSRCTPAALASAFFAVVSCCRSAC